MTRFIPKLDVLPPSQQLLWDRLEATPRHFVLYGGTALALRLGHRESDFDFFSSESFVPRRLLGSISYLRDQTVTQEDTNTLSCDIDVDGATVKVSYFGGLRIRQLEKPEHVETNGIAVASLIDLFGTKCATIPGRTEIKDYLDIHALLTLGKLNLLDGLASAKAIYGQQYNPILTLQALSYFDDLPTPLPESMKAKLLTAVKSATLENLPIRNATQGIG